MSCPRAGLRPATIWTSAFQSPYEDQADHHCSSEMADVASGSRETSTAPELLLLSWCPSPMRPVMIGLVGKLGPAQDNAISSSPSSAKRGDLSLHACLSSSHRPLLVSAGSSLISFLTIAFEQGKEHPNHGCLHSHVQLHRGLHKPSTAGLLAFQCPKPISLHSLTLLNHHSPQTASCSAQNWVGNSALGKKSLCPGEKDGQTSSEVETLAHSCPPKI